MRYKVRKLYACKLIPEGTIINQETFDELDIFKKAFKPIKEKIKLKHFSTSNGNISGFSKYQIIKNDEDEFTNQEIILMEDALNDIPNKKHLKEFSKYCEKVIGRDKLYIQGSLIDDFINEKNKPND